jgi:hypothetical protein
MTRRLLKTIAFLLLCTGVQAQTNSTAFRAYLYNNVYNVYLRINFHDQNIEVPGQELYGQLPGYLGKVNNSFCWVIVSCKVKNENEAELKLINDFGSEDLSATLTRENDSTYILRQVSGSTIKVPNKGKWQRLPKKLDFKKK